MDNLISVYSTLDVLAILYFFIMDKDKEENVLPIAWSRFVRDVTSNYWSHSTSWYARKLLCYVKNLIQKTVSKKKRLCVIICKMVRREARFDWNNEYGYVVEIFFWLNHSLPNIRQLYKKIKKMPSIHLTYSLYTTSLPKHTDYQRALRHLTRKLCYVCKNKQFREFNIF